MPAAVATIALLCIAMAGTARAGQTTRYPAMAPLRSYLMADRQSEIDLARTAAPPSISKDSTVLVLGPHGYETAVTGTNGFTCYVDRSWTKAFDDDNFWNPRVRTAICFNAPATRTVLPYVFFATKQALSGATEAQIDDRMKAAIADKQLSVPENGSMAYMMSKVSYIDDHVKAWYPHVMIYAPSALGVDAGSGWGADLAGSPVVYDSGHLLWPQPWALFMVPVAHWSDGSASPPM